MIKYITSITLLVLLFTNIAFSEENLEASDSKADQELTALRNKIDVINEEILVLLNHRAQVVLEIGELKKQNSMEVYDPGREREIENKLISINKGPLPNDAVVKIFREIISASRDLQ